MIHMTLQVLAIAVSACKKFVAIADAAGILSLYKISEVLLFGHSVCALYQVCNVRGRDRFERRAGSGGDSVVGDFIAIGELASTEFEHKLLENDKDISSKVLKNTRFEWVNVDRLREKALSCMLVHRVQSEQYVIIGIMQQS
ncbi:unnamed protein product [Peronospora farinosa]|uniref:Uncharacterized protein n=1 Tax=Peronospora farinosa TaxID=134698 RepID=A0AAV0THU9_9STRA|nr:unnamed protein product [Peronospora farinosa]CAI5722181.1 unnamed protein product [Peronospora farinosa]